MHACLFAIVCLACAVVAGACTSFEGTPCSPGDAVRCMCLSNGSGLSRCAANGSGYGACDCTERDAGSDVGVESADAGYAFMSPCERDEQCATGTCFSFNAKGMRCSKACSNASECEAPSTGCNNQGMCKAP